VFLLPRNADGRSGPLFKSFATILPAESTDCLGVTRERPLYTPDGVWARQTDAVRRTLRADFDHVTPRHATQGDYRLLTLASLQQSLSVRTDAERRQPSPSR
jgi:hypothetical protein